MNERSDPHRTVREAPYEKARARLRKQALDWLRADLAASGECPASGNH